MSSLALVLFNVKPPASLGRVDFAPFVAGFYLEAFIRLEPWKYFAPQPWRSRVVLIAA